jgi:hypothetical protein
MMNLTPSYLYLHSVSDTHISYRILPYTIPLIPVHPFLFPLIPVHIFLSGRLPTSVLRRPKTD